jgi:ligand-binding sensor domain-containing protein/signal transduction histidine kinase
MHWRRQHERSFGEPKAWSILIASLLLCALSSRSQELMLTNQPVVGRNADGHLEVFRVEADGELRHRWQRPERDEWSAWSSLGGNFLPGFALTTNVQGGLEIFAIRADTGHVVESSQKEANSTEWTAWADLGGKVRPPLGTAFDAQQNLQVFGVEAGGGTVRRIIYDTTRDEWSEWSSLGGDLAGGLVVARNKDGRLELFGISRDDSQLVHCWQRERRAGSAWSEWVSLGRAATPGFVADHNNRGILEVFIVERNTGHVQRLCQLTAGSSDQWRPWEDFGARIVPGLSLGKSGDGRIEIMAVSAENGILLHRWENLVDGSDLWSAWAPLGIASRPAPAVIKNEDGDMEVFAVDVAHPGQINHRRQISRASDWLDWSSLDQAPVQYSSRSWQTDEGLPNNNVQAIAQTRDGYLWAGTRAGLARFDGVAFTAIESKDNPQLWHSPITSLCGDRSGALWIGTESDGLLRLKNGEFSRFGTNDGLAGNSIRAIHQGRDGSIWVGTMTGMSRLRSGVFTTYGRKQGLSSEIVRALYEDRDGNLWIATGEGLNRLRAESMDTFPMPSGLPNDSVRSICQDRGGRIWIGSNNGMLWYNWYWMTGFYAYNTKYGLSDTFVSAICEDQGGNLWVGTYSGLNRFHEGRFFGEHNQDGAPFEKVNTLFADREGNLWVGSREGLTRLSPKRFVSLTRADGLTHNNTTCVLEDRRGGMWVGTWGGGLNHIQEDRVSSYLSTNVSQALVLSVCETRDGSIWFGADFDGGLTRLKEGHLDHYTSTNGLIDAAVRVLLEDRAGHLWIGTSRGLCHFSEGKCGADPQLQGETIRALLEDRAGALWIGTEHGLKCLKDDRCASWTRANGLSDDVVTALYEDERGELWVGTGAGGLCHFRGGRFSSFTIRNGLFTDEILEMLEDGEGWFWFSSSKGIFRVRRSDLERVERGEASVINSVVYGKNDGIESLQCSSVSKPSACRTRDGRLWFATSKGLARVDPAATVVSEMPPPVHIEQVVVNGRPIASLESLENTAGAESSVLTLPAGGGEVEFRYTALNLQAPENSRFKYRLENVDQNWVNAGSRRSAVYNNVGPGKYEFQVLACNRDGVWAHEPVTLSFLVRPRLWQTWWAQTSMVLAALGLTGATARYMTRRRLQRRLAALEQRHAIERERGRIAKDIHDDLGSSLTRIMMLGERVEESLDEPEDVRTHVQKIVNSARGTVQSLDEIVWAVNPDNDTLEGLVQYISHYADEFFENTDIACRLEMPVELPDLVLPAEFRHDLFLAIKEALNNTAKHARATAVHLHLSADREHVEILIEDNGCGFDPGVQKEGRHGNGLRNMRKRVESLGGTIEFNSAPAKGTSIRIKVNIKPR